MEEISIIKYEGPNDVLVWKHPEENFNTKTQLIVHANQEAIFFKDGQALDSFGSGRYALETENIPLLRRLIKLPFGKKTPFHCEVYFVNKITSMNVRWGTDSPIDMEDPKYNIFVRVRSFGQMAVRVTDARKFLLKIVGQISLFNHDTLQDYFRGVMMSYIKDQISQAMITRGISFLEVTAQMRDISRTISDDLRIEFEEYGIELVNFYINSISVPNDDYAKLKAVKETAAVSRTQIDTEAYKVVQMGRAQAIARKEQDYTYQEEKQFDVLNEAVKNKGNSNIMNTGMDFGIGLNVGNKLGEAISNMATNGLQNKKAPKEDSDKTEVFCTSCGTANSVNAKFCCECGNQLITQKSGCPNCGNEITPGAKFCGECGQKL